MGTKKKFWEQFYSEISPFLRHTLAMVVALACIALVETVLTHFLGHDAKLFDSVPIVYVAHAGDTIVFARFLLMLLKEAISAVWP